MTTPLMPIYLQGTAMANAWDQVVALAAAQHVNPVTQEVDITSLPVDQVQALDALGAAQLSPDGQKIKLISAQPEAPTGPDVTGATAAAKEHTFADPVAD